MKITFVFMLFLFEIISFASDREKQIQQFVEDELDHYPEAWLTDLYKNYFQDAYGPGHLIPDTTRAGAYLDWELQQPDWVDTLLYQPLGTNHDFYRINLVLVKNGTIPRDTLLLGMVKSAGLARKPDIESWKREWTEVLQVIKKIKPDLPQLRSDEKLIVRTLAKGEVVMHHSKHYEETYHPHYRIIHRSVFEEWKGKYLNCKF
ncbi:MAG: hypothetical protein AB7D05_11315 [Mangrovibacterium sp.]